MLQILEEAQTRWTYLARPEQVEPPGDWNIWLILAGRGWGKTRTAAEWIVDQARKTKNGRFALVASTLKDARLTMLEGGSGILSLFKPHELLGGSQDTAYNRTSGELWLENGSQFNVYTAESPNGLRGHEHHACWCDELAAWKDASIGEVDTEGQGTTWSNLTMTMRLGKKSRTVIATTPRPVALLKDLVKRAKERGDVHITKGKTTDNLQNLSANFKAAVVDAYAGTTIGRQELDGELLEETKGALWTWKHLEPIRVQASKVPDLRRIVIAIDPAISATKGSDLTGIVAVGIGYDGLLYVLDDASGVYTPGEWALEANALYEKHEADCFVAEVNQGGDMVENTMRQVNKTARYKAVRASRGKVLRAEPIVALYEQARVRHVTENLRELENQMTSWSAGTGEKSPDRVDALVWGITELALTKEKRVSNVY
ncbi:DNA-packaging protein [Hymenobacter sp. NBH84]|nr:DNA-packaging protein [Hymenobacter sp. NBH84]